jgi:hypothetical protein
VALRAVGALPFVLDRSRVRRKAAQTNVPADGPLKTCSEWIKHRRGSKLAKVPVAREILTRSDDGLRDGWIRRLEAAAARASPALAIAPSDGRLVACVARRSAPTPWHVFARLLAQLPS